MTPADMVAWRERMGYTQDDAAEALKVTRHSIGSWENGRWPVRHITALACWALEMQKQMAEQDSISHEGITFVRKVAPFTEEELAAEEPHVEAA